MGVEMQFKDLGRSMVMRRIFGVGKDILISSGISGGGTVKVCDISNEFCLLVERSLLEKSTGIAAFWREYDVKAGGLLRRGDVGFGMDLGDSNQVKEEMGRKGLMYRSRVR